MIVIRVVALAAVALGAIGCKTVQPLVDPAQSIPQANPDVVFVTYKDRSLVAVSQPRVSGDSLFGTEQGVGEPIAVSLSEIDHMAALQPDGKKTFTAFAVLVPAAAITTYLALKFAGAGKNCDSSRGNTDQQGGAPPVGECADGAGSM